MGSGLVKINFKNMLKKYFVLSGGGCRGFAHLGVVKALNEHGIFPKEIAGASAGALAGAFLANGFTPDEIKEMVLKKLKSKIFAWNGLKSGLASMKYIRGFVLNNLRYTKFEDLPIPFYATATNFETGRQYIFSKGNIIDALIASCSVPVLFPPVVINGTPYVDGGLSNNLPVDPFNNRKQDVISVHVNPLKKQFNSKEKFIETIDRTLSLSFKEMVGRSSEGCFLFVEPAGLNKFSLFDTHRLPDIFETGYQFTKELLQKSSF